MSCLILRAYLKSAYRGIVEFLDTSDKPRETMGLKALPHDSTLKCIADWPGGLEIVEVMLTEVAKQFVGEEEQVAIDSTGLETPSASSYLQTRSGRWRKK